MSNNLQAWKSKMHGTPFDLAVSSLVGLCKYCPIKEKCNIKKLEDIQAANKCFNNLKQMFKDNSTILDGWDVVLDIYEMVNGRIETLLTIKSLNTHMVPKKMLKEVNEIKSFIKFKLKEAGIEVE